MIRRRYLVLAAFGLAACNTSVPDSGVGFQDYNSYVRSAQPAPVAPAPVVTAPAAPVGFDPAAAAAAIDRADGRLPSAVPSAPVSAVPLSGMSNGPLDPNRPRGNQPVGIAEQSGEMEAVGAVVGGAAPVAPASHAGISDEQDFAAVSQRETIESDKQRIERNKANYVVVQPGAVPTRTGEGGPNIVQFALSTSHAPGSPMYTRRGNKDPSGPCARYGSPDLAQEAFLGAGGPEKDKLGIDPDGDGFACGWDPRPFRTALN